MPARVRNPKSIVVSQNILTRVFDQPISHNTTNPSPLSMMETRLQARNRTVDPGTDAETGEDTGGRDAGDTAGGQGGDEEMGGVGPDTDGRGNDTTGGDTGGDTGGPRGTDATTGGNANDGGREEKEEILLDPIDVAQLRAFKAFLQYTGFTPADAITQIFVRGLSSMDSLHYQARKEPSCEHVQMHREGDHWNSWSAFEL
jgi:hypothetical protein